MQLPGSASNNTSSVGQARDLPKVYGAWTGEDADYGGDGEELKALVGILTGGPNANDSGKTRLWFQHVC